ncbi:SWIM zinc finger family protein [Streptomyces hyaluromycini]|uniref:SWIM zinc finger family protein n=1 Tax=Streptomyces hyaluromycini TaxID=1377993 RepID=UPI000B5C35C1|nr:SWIM zinc finger family protein [Streptomyces hyaluromycini]
MSGDGEQRPGDAARRALRAARGRGAENGAEGAAPGECAEREPRPGDAARLALRVAAAAKEAEQRDAEPGPEPEPEAEAEAGAGADRTDHADHADTGAFAAVRPGGRPGDVARAALRAARAEARRAEEAAAAEAPEQSPPRAVGRPPTPSPAPASAARGRTARDLKQFLTTAFRMPRDETEPDEPDEPEQTGVRADQEPPTEHPEGARPTVGRPPRAIDAAPLRASASALPERPGDAPAAPSRRPASAESPAPAKASHRPEPNTPAPVPAALSAPSTGSTPTGPRLPSTMATPHRDTELRRTFPSLSPRASASASASASGFAETWWGNAWVRALEEGALDVKRLGRGRGYAERGHVDAITVTPGMVLAYVQGSRPRPYRVQLRLRTFGEDEWERLLEAAADRPADIAALLDKELPQTLADSGVPLLPEPGELEPRCSCPDFGHPCKHAAALCYQTARLLDADPFVLLLLRGRGEREVLDALSRRSAARAARDRQPASLPGIRATEALAPRRLPPLPPPLAVPAHPEQPPVYPGVPGGPDPFALDQLATDAAARAHAVLTTGHDPVGELTLWQDAVRLAAARPGSGLTASTRALYATLADAVGRTPGDLARAVAAWRQGGLEGLAVLEEPWDPPAGRFDRARPLLLAADLPAFRPSRNHLTHPGGHLQLRFGRDGLWYAYESEPGHDDWWPRGTPDLDPVGALTGLGASDDL